MRLPLLRNHSDIIPQFLIFWLNRRHYAWLRICDLKRGHSRCSLGELTGSRSPPCLVFFLFFPPLWKIRTAGVESRRNQHKLQQKSQWTNSVNIALNKTKGKNTAMSCHNPTITEKLWKNF
jgi:hypothetical protein